jgi:alpha-tubulin suppressor-like RCC1 family protein
VPVQSTVIGNAQVGTVAAGNAYTCVTTTDGALWCWGTNNNGQLGDGTTTNSLTAVKPDIGCP